MSTDVLKHLWLLDRLRPESCRYTVAFHLHGNLDPASLERALRLAVERHPALRTRAAMRDGALVAVIDPPERFALLRSPFAGDLRAEAQAEHARPLRISEDLPFRARLAPLGERDHALLLTAHDIAGGRSALIDVARMVSGAEGAPCARLESPCDVAWWRASLTPPPAPLDLPLDAPWQTGQCADAFDEVPLGAMEPRLRGVAAELGCEPISIVLAATAALIESMARQPELTIAVPGGVDAMPIRLRLQGDPAFHDVVVATQEAIDVARVHPAPPIDVLSRELSGGQPLAAIIVSAPAPLRLELQGLETIATVECSAPRFALALELHAGVVCLRTATACIRPETARRILGRLSALLSAALSQPGLLLSQLPVATAEEERSVLVEWNATAVPYPRDASVHQLFEAQVRATPEAIALELLERRVTYAELDLRATRLASALRRNGVMPSDRIGICAERGIEAIVAMIAALKAGAAYVPIDPAYPVDRVAFMLEDAEVRVLLATPELAPRLPAHAARLVLLDGAEDGPADAIPAAGGPDSVAYAMFTSGSTGRPKAVAVPHRAIVRLVKGANYARLGPDQVFLQAAPISFDASTLEIWGALLNGGKLAILPGLHPSLAEIGAAIRRHGVTILWLTAGLFHVMVDERLDDLRPLQQLLAGGDVLSVPHVRRVRREIPQLRLINGYGPTENTTFSCCHDIEADPAGAIPIGKPISNSTAYVLDHRLRPQPPGVPGELFVGGDGLATGYLRRPELTAERFVETRFGRLYRTGDLARWSAEGAIEFFGRIDTQVKIRGFRIELGEIESVLCQHPAVREAAVAAREIGPNDRRLLAYVVPRAPMADASAELRAWLAARLPEFMVPAGVAVLDKLPLGATGKVDRRALPEIDPGRRAPVAPAAPGSILERKIAGIWQGVLGEIRFGPHDNFFEIGGTSLQIVQVHSQVEQLLGRELPIMRLFEFPSVAALARHLEPSGPAAMPAGLTAAQERASRQRAALQKQQALRRNK